MVLPLLKLGTLALKTFSKPVANKLKQQAKLHPRFRQFIIDIAQSNHQITTKMQRRIYGHATDVEIRPLDEEKAVQAAADLIGELFVFSSAGITLSSMEPYITFLRMVGVVALLFEVQRSARSEARKEELRKQELEAVRQRNEDLAKEMEFLKDKIAELEKLAHSKGLSGMFNFKTTESQKSATAA